MVSTYSTNLGIELIATGEQSGTWGATTNANLGTLLEQAIAGYSTQTVTDSSSATVLTIADGASSTGRNAVISLTGSLTAARVVEVPAKTKTYIFANNTTGGFAVTVKVTGQTGVSIPNGTKAIVYCDATDVRNVISNITVDSSGNVGIGTTSPATKLNVYGSSVVGRFESTNNTNVVALAYNGTVGGYLGANGTNLIFSNNSGTEALRIDSSGNMGIGTSSPNTKIQVYKPSVSSFTGTSLGGIVVTDSNATANYYSAIDFNTQANNALPLARVAMQYTGGGSYLNFGTSNNYANGITNTAMSIDPTGNVGIGTSTPGQRLDLGGGSLMLYNSTGTQQIYLYRGSATNYSSIGTDSSAGGITFTTGTSAPSERMRINSSGNVGIGTTSPAYKLHVSASSASSTVYAGVQNSGATGTAALLLYASNVGATNYSTLQQDYNGYTSLTNYYASGGMTFGTASTERMRIDTNGNLLVGTTTASGKFTVSGGSIIGGYFSSTGNHGVLGTSNNGYAVYGDQTGTTYGGVIGYDNVNAKFGILAYQGYGLYTNASINVNGTVYTSDARLKENIVPITNSLQKINALNPVSFDWKAKSSRGFASDFGLIAQEVEQVIPECVFETKTPPRTLEMTHEPTLEDELGSYKGVDYSRFIPFLIAAIQEQQKLIQGLSAEVTALKAKVGA